MLSQSSRSAAVAVVVVNYNTREALRACLASVLSEPAEIIVVDNTSTDGSAVMVKNCFPQVRLIETSNKGYGTAAQIAIEACKTPYVLLLNSDTLIAPGSVAAISRYMETVPSVGIMGPRLVDMDNRARVQPSCLPFPGTIRWFFDNDLTAPILRMNPGLRRWSLRAWDHNQERTVPWVKGAALVIRRTALESVGGFERSIFLYHEETDLCFRLKQAGWSIQFAPVIEIAHEGAVSTRQIGTKALLYLHNSTIDFYRRHYSPQRTAFLIGVWKIIITFRCIRDWTILRVVTGKFRAQREENLNAWKTILKQSGGLSQ